MLQGLNEVRTGTFGFNTKGLYLAENSESVSSMLERTRDV